MALEPTERPHEEGLAAPGEHLSRAGLLLELFVQILFIRPLAYYHPHF